jgi:O-Antigen ligase
VSADALLALVSAAALVTVAFLTKASTGEVGIGAITWTEILVVLLGAGCVVAAVITGARGPAWGVAALALFVALAALTYASIGWSVQPAISWLEGNRALSYLAAFAGAMALARIVPGRWPALIGTIAISATALSGWALLAKVFPGTLDASDTLGRLSAPFGYWNAVGLMAALGLPCCLWAGARRESPRVLRTLAVPALAVLLIALVLSYGRGALAAAVVGLALWFVLVPFRLRAALVLTLGVSGAAVAIVWALTSPALTHDKVGLAARVSAGHSFAIVLALTLATLTVVGYWAAVAVDRVRLAADVRRRIGVTLLTPLLLLPLAGVVALGASSRGLGGEISHVWSTLTNPQGGAGNVPGRLVQLGSSRPRYWREGLLVGEHSALKGVGAGGFEVASLRYDHNRWDTAAHAHSYVIQTFSDLGLVGLAVSSALLMAWAFAAARSVELRRTRAGPEHAADRQGPAHAVERVGLITLLAVVVIFGVHSAIDWTWFVPAVALPGLVCAGWLAGRGPLAQPVGRLERVRRPSTAPGAAAAVTAIVALALAGVWFIWQPLRSANADSAAFAALSRGDTAAAFSDARSAATYDPDSIEPLRALEALYSSIRYPAQARLQLVRAVSLQPENPSAWQDLGGYDLSQHHPRLALTELRHALTLNPGSPSIAADIALASAPTAGAGAGTKAP